MIKNISGGQYIDVMSGNSSYPYVNMSNPSAGMMRYNGNNQNLEVYDGSSWMTISGNSSMVDLNNDAKELLAWARIKRAEETERDRLAKSNPAIKDLMKQISDKEEQIKMVMTLIKSPGHESDEQVQSSP